MIQIERFGQERFQRSFVAVLFETESFNAIPDGKITDMLQLKFVDDTDY